MKKMLFIFLFIFLVFNPKPLKGLEELLFVFGDRHLFIVHLRPLAGGSLVRYLFMAAMLVIVWHEAISCTKSMLINYQEIASPGRARLAKTNTDERHCKARHNLLTYKQVYNLSGDCFARLPKAYNDEFFLCHDRVSMIHRFYLMRRNNYFRFSCHFFL